ncbi:glycosyl hydrolase 2 galactose-binding domain-containing protein [Microbacterium sp. NPDC089695]|uniref:glycoside hydrolase family 2 protein n=1 Tax=Microbacterium sp. NPDC089695 TaxID=3364198 RepID=UPI00381D5471
MTISLPLATGWTLSAVDAAPGTPAAALPAEIPATVPGTVHTDLLAAGLIDDPYLDLNELKDEWIGRTTWVYRTTIEWQGSAEERTDLVFDGLDTVAVVTLNGVEIGRTFNQHRTYRFDVTALLQPGANELEVRFDSAWDYAEGVIAELGDLPNAYPTPFGFIRKMAANFGWDWGPQLVTAGIWKEARLESWSGARLAEVRTAVTLDGTTGVARVTVLLETVGADVADRVLAVEVAGQRVEVPATGAGLIEAEVRVPDVAVWWPHGMGEQPLHDLTVEVRDGADVRDAWTRRIGFRTVELDTREDAEGSAFTFVINGVPLFIRGANWIPDDCFPSRITPERYRDRIEQSIGANLNLLRVWGGGIYERDEFYDICDELGVLTWQDFLFACAAYPEEEPIRSEVIAEARDNVLRLSSHASLVLWNGCNENIWGWFDWNWQSELGDRTWGLGYYTEVLPEVVAELDPTTPYWAGSPFSGSMEVHANEPSRGNMHIWDVWNRVDYTVYGDYRPRFVSEFGFQGPPTWSTLTRAIHDVPLTPDSPGMLLHQKAEDGNGKLLRGMAPHLPEARSMEDWHYLTQLNQSRAIVFGTEWYRSQRGHCMGTIVWQINDCWPVTSWAAVDGDGRRKPLWHGLRRANAERIATVQPTDDGGLALVLVNDSRESWQAAGALRRLGFGGDERAVQSLSVEVPALDRVSVALTADVAQPGDARAEFVSVEVSGARPSSHVFAEDKDLALAATDLGVVIGPWVDGRQTVELTADVFVRGVCLFPDRIDPAAWVDDSDVDVIPGRTTVLTVESAAPLDPSALGTHPVLRSVNDVIAG